MSLQVDKPDYPSFELLGLYTHSDLPAPCEHSLSDQGFDSFDEMLADAWGKPAYQVFSREPKWCILYYLLTMAEEMTQAVVQAVNGRFVAAQISYFQTFSPPEAVDTTVGTTCEPKNCPLPQQLLKAVQVDTGIACTLVRAKQVPISQLYKWDASCPNLLVSSMCIRYPVPGQFLRLDELIADLTISERLYWDVVSKISAPLVPISKIELRG